MTEDTARPVTFGAARWVRAALQVNPYGYKGMGSPASKFADEAAYNVALLDTCQAEGIELIGVTDHWRVDSAAGLIEAAAGGPVTVLPGFEANTSEGIHLLVIFEVGTDLAVITAAIGACGVSPGCENGTTGNAYDQIMHEMTKRGALVIPAHANVANSGMLTGHTGKPLEQMIKHSDLHAIGITPSQPEAKDQKSILNGRRPFKRQYPLAEVHADDVCHPDTLENDGASTWFKVSSPSLASLKHAVRIPSTRVSLKNPHDSVRVVFQEISWTGGFLDGVTVALAHDLTTLIGGRGTGKSAVIESVRYLLGTEPIGENARADHLAIVKNVLQSGTVVRLVVSAVSPNRAQYAIQRTVPDPPVVLDASGNRTTLRPIDVVGKIELFGQHELAEVAQQKTSVARMIEGFTGESDTNGEYDDLRRRLKDNRERISRAEQDKLQLVEALADTSRLEEAVAQYEASDLPGKLKEQKRLGQDEAVFKEGRDRLSFARQAAGQLADSDIVTQLAQEYEEIEESDQAPVLRRVVTATKQASERFTEAIQALDNALIAADDEIEAAFEAWKAATDPQRDKHAEVLRKLKAEGHEPDKYLATTKALDVLRSKAPRLKTVAKQIKQLHTERSALLGELDKHEAARQGRLAQAIRTANSATGRSVLVKPVPSPDREHLRNCVVTHVQNSRAALLEVIKADDFSSRTFVAAARGGAAELEGKYAIRGAQAVAIAAAGEPFLRELEELTVAQAVDVSLDVSSTKKMREYRSLDELSKGQRATALLLLLLGAAESPLVIDQPEDDLDNRFVYDQVVHRLRELKGARQVIVSTHNANIPVLGDAELVVTLEGDGQRGWPMDGGTGSLDNDKVRDIAEHILEGGREAFEARMHLYGI